MGDPSPMPQGGLLAAAWCGLGVAGLFLIARTWIRLTLVKRISNFTADDYFVLAAWGFLLANAIVYTLQAPALYYYVWWFSHDEPSPSKIDYYGNLYVRYEFASIGLFWTVLWCIKGAFLAMYFRLSSGLAYYRIWIWIVAVFAFLAFVGNWVASAFNCHPPSLYFVFGACSKPIDIRGTKIAIGYSTAVDVLTDLLIILTPIPILYKLSATFRVKIGLMVVFSLGIVIIVIAIIRLVNVISIARSDPTWLAFWGVIESSVSVVIGCLPPFKSLIKHFREKSQANRQTPERYDIDDGIVFSSQNQPQNRDADRWDTASISENGEQCWPLSGKQQQHPKEDPHEAFSASRSPPIPPDRSENDSRLGQVIMPGGAAKFFGESSLATKDYGHAQLIKEYGVESSVEEETSTASETKSPGTSMSRKTPEDMLHRTR